jgi:hypothetical protein
MVSVIVRDYDEQQTQQLMSNHKDLLREMGIEFQTKDFVETIL